MLEDCDGAELPRHHELWFRLVFETLVLAGPRYLLQLLVCFVLAGFLGFREPFRKPMRLDALLGLELGQERVWIVREEGMEA